MHYLTIPKSLDLLAMLSTCFIKSFKSKQKSPFVSSNLQDINTPSSRNSQSHTCWMPIITFSSSSTFFSFEKNKCSLENCVAPLFNWTALWVSPSDTSSRPDQLIRNCSMCSHAGSTNKKRRDSIKSFAYFSIRLNWFCADDFF